MYVLPSTFLNSPCLCQIKVSSNGGANYIIGEINSHRQLEHSKFNAKPLKILFSESSEQNS